MAAGPITDDMKWRSSSDGYIATEFDDTYLVFVKASAETHFLNFLSFGIVTETESVAQTATELAMNLRRRFELTDEELTQELVSLTLSELDDTGLIWPETV
ncbi:HPr-rel-A system PqqD family peptide chaperone [Kordiimonas aquimaris]|uniref:HPr-rel-A system PqqD family peptide chaperone n=1 Tax=Kordiimonas aquimaris TaxID=707591 RepID=UPI0021D1DBFB|nr:HPr-rel-A system PqqD family peptide chaperone [Kordiimonas aquimaris]